MCFELLGEEEEETKVIGENELRPVTQNYRISDEGFVFTSRLLARNGENSAKFNLRRPGGWLVSGVVLAAEVG